MTVDYMDQFSRPARVENLGIITVFHMNVRKDPRKPGRGLSVLFDKREPLVEGFDVAYIYDNVILNPGNPAGNHYHVKKRELMIVSVGAFEIKAEDIKTGERSSVVIKSTPEAGTQPILYIPAETAHSVRALEQNSVILVLATSPNNDGDEYPHQITW